MSQYFYVYILSNRVRGVLYVGVTSNLIKRVWEHKNDFVRGFTKKYRIKRLVYYEQLGDPINAITREKSVKRWRREWKIALIESFNPEWRDLYEEII